MQCANKVLWLARHRVYNQIIGNLDTPLEEITRNQRENVTPRFSPISCNITVIARRSSETDIDLHGGEAHDLKWEISGIPPTTRI